MSDVPLKVCPICESGWLTEVFEDNLHYSICSFCKSETADSVQVKKNKDLGLQLAINRIRTLDLLNQPTRTVPGHLTREEKRVFICSFSEYTGGENV